MKIYFSAGIRHYLINNICFGCGKKVNKKNGKNEWFDESFRFVPKCAECISKYYKRTYPSIFICNDCYKKLWETQKVITSWFSEFEERLS